ncbi:MAG: DUF2924 domain-containing protein [bacterium]|nr:DUF2924 domain-containing protein [bacterium]
MKSIKSRVKSGVTSKKVRSLEDLLGSKYSVSIRAEHKGTKYRARLQKSGKVRFKGKTLISLTQAAKAITGYATSGVWFWKIKTGKTEWVRIRSLLK